MRLRGLPGTWIAAALIAFVLLPGIFHAGSWSAPGVSSDTALPDNHGNSSAHSHDAQFDTPHCIVEPATCIEQTKAGPTWAPGPQHVSVLYESQLLPVAGAPAHPQHEAPSSILKPPPR